jgi:hypothetical protein
MLKTSSSRVQCRAWVCNTIFSLVDKISLDLDLQDRHKQLNDTSQEPFIRTRSLSKRLVINRKDKF